MNMQHFQQKSSEKLFLYFVIKYNEIKRNVGHWCNFVFSQQFRLLVSMHNINTFDRSYQQVL